MLKPKLDSAFGAKSSPFMQQQVGDPFSDSDQVVPTTVLEDAPIVPRNVSRSLTEQDTIVDIDYVRRTLQFTTERAQQLVDLALENAADGSSPRDIEVAANALNTCANISEKLVTLYQNLKTLQERPKQDLGTGNTFVNNNKTILVNTSDLLKELTTKDILNEET